MRKVVYVVFMQLLCNLCVEGLPKPAIIHQAKAITQSHGYRAIDFTWQDVTYVVTPLYHSAATCVGVFNTIAEGKLSLPFSLFLSLSLVI